VLPTRNGRKEFITNFPWLRLGYLYVHLTLLYALVDELSCAIEAYLIIMIIIINNNSNSNNNTGNDNNIVCHLG